MAKIELSESEINVIEKQLSDDFDPFLCSDEERDLMSGVIDKAESLMHELEAYEESGNNLIAWFYDKYKKQLDQS